MNTVLNIIKWLNWIGSGITILIILFTILLVDTPTSIGLTEVNHPFDFLCVDAFAGNTYSHLAET